MRRSQRPCRPAGFRFSKNFWCFSKKDLIFSESCSILIRRSGERTEHPGVAKFGIALEWGSRGPEFESRHSDQKGLKTLGFQPFLFVFRTFFREKFSRVLKSLIKFCCVSPAVSPVFREIQPAFFGFFYRHACIFWSYIWRCGQWKRSYPRQKPQRLSSAWHTYAGSNAGRAGGALQPPKQDTRSSKVVCNLWAFTTVVAEKIWYCIRKQMSLCDPLVRTRRVCS